jgi:integrase
VLGAHRDRQDAEKAAAAEIYEDGMPYYPRYLTQEWERCCRAAGVPVISLHDGRHTAATTGADAGVPQHIMKDLLGHADARTTDEWYTHVLDPSKRKAADLMEGAIFGTTQPPTEKPQPAASNPTRRLADARRRIRRAA